MVKTNLKSYPVDFLQFLQLDRLNSSPSVLRVRVHNGDPLLWEEEGGGCKSHDMDATGRGGVGILYTYHMTSSLDEHFKSSLSWRMLHLSFLQYCIVYACNQKTYCQYHN